MKKHIRLAGWGMGIALGMVATRGFSAGLPGDAEAASHGDVAATLQPVRETEQQAPAFTFRQYNLAVLSHYSYLLGSGGEAMIVDPARDISRYLKDATELGLTIKYVYLTHSHADFVAGHMELAKAVGAEIIMNEATGALFPHRKVKDGDVIRLGSIKGVVLTTPGHTPDGTCLAVHAPAESPQPQLLLTGDTLFIGSVGRPDLIGDRMSAASLARMGFESWRDKLSKLPDETRIFPAHGAGSLCGAHLSDKPVSTIGEQRKENTYLQHRDLNSYVMAVIDGLPEAPQYFGHNARMNHDGPPLVEWLQTPVAVSPAELVAAAARGAWLIDVRDAAPYAAGHPKDAVNIGVRGRFETWTGIMVPWGTPFALIGSDDEAREAAFRLHRIGYDAPLGYLKGGVDAWAAAGLPAQTVKLVKPADLNAQMKDGSAPIIVDVRLPSEWMGLRIGNVLNVPLNRLGADAHRLDPELPVLTVCNSAYRSSLGAGVLQRLGFKDVRNMAGGSEAWIEAGLPTFGATAPGHAAPAAPAPGVYVNLPEPMEPVALARRLMDLPGTVDVVDIRPPWQYAEYHAEGAVNAPVEQVLNSPAYLVDKRPLVLVCRDGSISAAVAGMLTEKGPRPIRYVSGGMVRYYDEVLRPAGIASAPRPAAPGPAQPSAPSVAAPPPPPASPSPAPPSAPAAPKKRSAGC